MPFGPVEPELNLPSLETRRLAAWRDHDVINEVRRLRANGEPWIFYEGPPTANGRPGLHHVWARVFKDIYPRFQTMRGRNVPRKGGWDCHGLPVELEVEKELGLSTKQEIENFGIAEFNQRCRESVQRYVGDWTALTERSGVWIDTESAYWTLDNSYIESVWWLIKQLWDSGLLYEGHRVSPYCGRCGTALSSHELGQPDVYRDVVDQSVYVRFPLVDRDADILVWTTTPWTLISNVAAAVGADIEYVQVKSDGRDLIMAAARAEEDAEIVARFTGRDLVGLRYTRPFDDLPTDNSDAWKVVSADFVTTDDGSGIVHLAPAFGEDDAQVGRAEGLPVLNPVNGDAAFNETVPRFTGKFVKDADAEIIADLANRNLLVKEQAYEHSYPHCWRCSTPLIYWAKTSWFVRTSEKRDLLLRENETINWHPEFIKHGRFGKWLEGNIDWALSRDRYWGTPLPIWRCTSGHEHCVGSVAELSALAGRELSDLDLHRPYVDDITFTCPVSNCGAVATRVTPVLDAWFDSGSMPSAQHHFPFESADKFPGAFPADFICEAIDQTRGWFYSLLAVNSLVFDATPYRNVVCLALIVDENGQKMSKSRGNVIAPFDIFDSLGADALRWYFFSSGQPWTPRRVFVDGIREATRQSLLTLWNVYSFFTTYADLDGWDPKTTPRQAPTHVLDRWILSELDDTIANVTSALENFDALSGANRLGQFIDDLSNWYVRRSRPRFWKSSDASAHATLYECLVTTTQLLAPFCPFLSDEIYTTLTGELSVHCSDWPADQGRHRPELAAQMDAARRLVTLGRSARTDAKVKVRQPLARALVLHTGLDLDADIEQEIMTELNVKKLERLDSLSGLMGWQVLPNFRTLGPKLGPKVNEVKAALAAADGSALQAQLAANGFIEIAGERLDADDVELRAQNHADLALVEDEGWAVALDLDLTEELRTEGLARELIRAINDARKAAGLAISDRIVLRLEISESSDAFASRFSQMLDNYADVIAAETLATDIQRTAGDRELDLDGATLLVGLERVSG